MTLYEVFVWNHFRRGGKNLFQNFPLLPKYGNSTFEITCLTLVLYLTSQEFRHPILVMISPPTYIYFLFIILSTLRLNFGVSFYTSLISGIQFFALSYILLEEPSALEHEIHTSTPLPYLAKSIILVMAGAAAGFVGAAN